MRHSCALFVIALIRLLAYCLLSCSVLVISAADCHAQKDSSQTKIIPLPVVFSTPETGWAFGGVGVLSHKADVADTLTPAAQFQLGAVYTVQDQLLAYGSYEWYSRQRKYTARGEIGYYIYTYQYFGIGEQTIVEGEPYGATLPRVRFDGLRRVSPKWYVGIRYVFDDFDITRIETDGLLSRGVFGAEGGRISGLGGLVEYDSRDNVYSTFSGEYLNVRLVRFDRGIASEYDFTKMELDGRIFRKVQKVVIGLQGKIETNTIGVPFYQMATVGGPGSMRGYFSGRFRDRGAWLSQIEVRRPIFWRIGVSGFVGVGETFVQTPDLMDLRWAGGLGVRFALLPERRINFRVDYALGEAEDSGIYFTIGEAF